MRVRRGSAARVASASASDGSASSASGRARRAERRDGRSPRLRRLEPVDVASTSSSAPLARDEVAQLARRPSAVPSRARTRASPASSAAVAGDQHGALALAQVVAGRLAGDGGIAEDARARRRAAGRPRRGAAPRRSGAAMQVVVAAGEGGADVQRPLDGVLGGLEADDVHAPRRRRAASRVWPTTSRNWPATTSVLQRSRRPAPARAVGSRRARNMLVAPRQHQVAEQDRDATRRTRPASPDRGPPRVARLEVAVDAGPSAAGVGAVHQVVVHQGAALEPLERGGGGDDARVVGIAAGDEPAGEAELRPQPLAPGDEVDGRVDEVAEVGVRARSSRRALVARRRRPACDRRAVRKSGSSAGLVTSRTIPLRHACPMTAPSSTALRGPRADATRSSSSRPRTTTARPCCGSTIADLEPLDPTFVSVTYGAGGTSQERTVRITARIAEQTGDASGRAPDAGRPDHAARSSRCSSSTPPPASTTCWPCAATPRAARARRGSRTPTA